jgi:F-type H+/Na+-transporting ATPase subunit beta
VVVSVPADLTLNVPLLRRRVPNLTVAARAAGLRAATVSNLCTGKIPVARAEVRTLVTLASLAGCSLDELILRGNVLGSLETGIKVLDVFAPLVRGGTIGLVARRNVGQLVLLAELFVRARQRDFATVFWAPDEMGAQLLEVLKADAPLMTAADLTCATEDDVLAYVSQHGGERDVLLGTDRAAALSGALLALRQRFDEAGMRPVTTVLVDVRGDAADEDAPYGPLETLIRFDVDRASRNLYPAIDPVGSTSVLLEGASLEATHLSLERRASRLLRRYRELRFLVSARGVGSLPDDDRLLFQRGERLEGFLAQPFYVADPYTGRPGAWVSVQDALSDIRRILDGGQDHVAPAQLAYLGRLEA